MQTKPLQKLSQKIKAALCDLAKVTWRQAFTEQRLRSELKAVFGIELEVANCQFDFLIEKCASFKEALRQWKEFNTHIAAYDRSPSDELLVVLKPMMEQMVGRCKALNFEPNAELRLMTCHAKFLDAFKESGIESAAATLNLVIHLMGFQMCHPFEKYWIYKWSYTFQCA